MPATTPHEHWPYPLLADPATPADLKTLAQAMDTSLTRVDTDRRNALRRPTVSMARATGTQTVTVGTPIAVSYTVIEADTIGTANLTTNGDRIVVPNYPCVVRVDATVGKSATGTATAYEIAIERALTTLVLVRKLQAGVGRAHIAGLVRCAANDPLRLKVTAFGNAGASTSVIATTRLTATVICRAS